MRIAHLTTVHKRTDTRIFLKECASLRRAFDTSLIVADGVGANTVGDVDIIDVGKPSSRFRRFAASFLRVRREIIKSKFDVIHFHDPELIPLGLYLKSRGIKVIYDVHEDVPRDIAIKEWIPSSARRPLAASVSWLEKKAGDHFDGIVAATPTIASRFPPEKTRVIRNFPLLSELDVAAQSPYRSREPIFVHIGTLSEARGVKETVDAFSVLGEPKLLLGGSFNTKLLEAHVKASPGWSFVEYLGYASRPAVASALSRSRAGLCTLLPTQTHLDSYPVKLFEYMAASLPVIASNFPLWRELLKGIDCALFVDPTRPADIAAAMEWLLDNPGRAEEMGRAGRSAVVEKFNWKKESERLITFYDRLVLTH